MDEVVKAQTRQFLYDTHVDDVLQKQHILRAAMAQGYGLEPSSYTRPFPGSTTITNVTQTPTNPLKTAAIGGLSAIAAAGLVATAATVLSGDAAPATPPPTAAAAETAPAELRVKWWVEGDETGGAVEQLPSSEAP
jgi:hypothetical protein